MSLNLFPAASKFSAHVTPQFAEILTPQALAFAAKLARKFEARRRELMALRARRQAEFDAGKLPDFLPETQAHPRVRLDRGARAARPAGPPRRDHRADRPQDGDQRAQLRRVRLHGRFRGLQHADVGEHDRRPGQPARRGEPHDRVRQPRRQALPAERQDRDADRAPARLAPAGKARARRRRAGRRARSSISRSTSSTTPRRCSRATAGPTSTCPSWKATSRRGCGTTSSSPPSASSGSRRARSRPRC